MSVLEISDGNRIRWCHAIGVFFLLILSYVAFNWYSPDLLGSHSTSSLSPWISTSLHLSAMSGTIVVMCGGIHHSLSWIHHPTLYFKIKVICRAVSKSNGELIEKDAFWMAGFTLSHCV